MKKLLLFLTLLFWINAFNAQNISIQYNGEPAEAITDLHNTLHGYRAGKITIHKVPLTNRTGQEFYLSSVNGITELNTPRQTAWRMPCIPTLICLGFAGIDRVTIGL